MRTPRIFSAFVLAFLVCSAAYAQNNRSAVSINGSDANTCVPASPCRNFSYAISQTNPGGEVIALDSGGYGPFSINKAITIQAAPGAYAGVTATAGDAISISVPGNEKIVIRGLTLNGLGTANAGIAFTGGTASAELHVENVVIDGFVNYGIITFLNIRVQDSIIRNCGSGIWIDNAGGPVKGTIDHVQVKDISGGAGIFYPATGILSWRNATVLVRNSVLAFVTGNALFAAAGGKLNVENCLVANNNVGIRSQEAGTMVRVSNTMTTANTTGWSNGTGSGFETYGNNKTRGNTTDIAGTGFIVLVGQS